MPTRLAHLAAVAAFLGVAVAANWPLPLHLGTHLTGPPSGDAGVYVWNVWVFHHEAVAGRLPLFTSKVFPLTSGVDLTLHNYTIFANTLALPLVGRVGVVSAFNIVYLLLVSLNGYAVYLLARHLTRRHLESWLAGAVFAVSPVLVARSTAHFSLVAAAPLPLFVLALLKALDTGRRRWALVAGAVVAWAAFCDAYYPVYCVLLAAAIVGARLVAVRCVRRPAAARALTWVRAFDLLLVCLAGLVVGVAATRGWRFEILGQRIALVTLYTPVLVLTVLTLVRVAVALRPHLEFHGPQAWRRAVVILALVALGASIPLSPILVAAGERLREGTFVRPPIHWRSSPPGVDLVNFVLPNPNHPWLGAPTRDWLVRDRPDGFAEYAASLPLVVLAVVGVAWWRGRLPRQGLVLTIGVALLALGPFVHVAGVNTHVPGPWALGRYVPILGLARSPSRFTVIVTLCVAVLFALALVHLREASRRRRAVTGTVVALLAFELAPVPRILYPAGMPAIYAHVRDDPDDRVRVLELPVGLRDGTQSIGDFSALSQFHQTYHGKAVVGGYLSRVSKKRIERTERYPVLKLLLALSGGKTPGEGDVARAIASRDRFLEATRVGWVVVDRSRASEALEQSAVALFDLVKVDEAHDLVLYRPTRSAFSPQPPPRRTGR